jgi:hypothetical protein
MSKDGRVFSALKNTPEIIAYLCSGSEITSNGIHASRAIKWLLMSHKMASKNGFSHSYSFIHGWLPAYPETSGYIIPSLYIMSEKYHTVAVDTIQSTLDWLYRIQNLDGSFCDLADRPQVFDTGQILIGLNFLIQKDFTIAREMAIKASEWLVNQQDITGAFAKNTYKDRYHTYYSRVAAALIESGKIFGDQKYYDAGIKNIAWVIKQQEDNGWINYLSFEDDYPYSHNLVYVIEGLVASYKLTGQQEALNTAVRLATNLLNSINFRGGAILSQYNNRFEPTNSNICITGLCQWAATGFRLSRIGYKEFQSSANESLALAKSIQIVSSNSNIDGGLPGSKPINGCYMRFSIPNWGVKFFLDALYESENHEDKFYLL